MSRPLTKSDHCTSVTCSTLVPFFPIYAATVLVCAFICLNCPFYHQSLLLSLILHMGVQPILSKLRSNHVSSKQTTKTNPLKDNNGNTHTHKTLVILLCFIKFPIYFHRICVVSCFGSSLLSPHLLLSCYFLHLMLDSK